MLDMKKWPAYAPLTHWVYRLEYSMLALGMLAALYLHAALFKDLDIGMTVLLALMPDVVFLAILPAMKSGHWPAWGATLYNVTHSYVTWFVLMAFTSFLAGGIYWPMWAWAVHISVDRAIGFNLRS